MTETIYGNGATFKIKEESDGWWSIYRENEETRELSPIIQAKDREHALSYISRLECPKTAFDVIGGD